MTLTRAVQADAPNQTSQRPRSWVAWVSEPRPPEALQEIPRCLLRVAERQAMVEAADLATERQQGKASSPGLRTRYLVAREAVPSKQRACH
ncbi:hypothetical protein ACSS6W_009091 [Trichoderma asperelloides]